MELEALLKKHKLTQQQFDATKKCLELQSLKTMPLEIIKLHALSHYRALIKTDEIIRELDL